MPAETKYTSHKRKFINQFRAQLEKPDISPRDFDSLAGKLMRLLGWDKGPLTKGPSRGKPLQKKDENKDKTDLLADVLKIEAAKKEQAREQRYIDRKSETLQ